MIKQYRKNVRWNRVNAATVNNKIILNSESVWDFAFSSRVSPDFPNDGRTDSRNLLSSLRVKSCGAILVTNVPYSTSSLACPEVGVDYTEIGLAGLLHFLFFRDSKLLGLICLSPSTINTFSAFSRRKEPYCLFLRKTQCDAAP